MPLPAVPAFVLTGLVTVAGTAGVIRTSFRDGVLGERGLSTAAWQRVLGDPAFADSLRFTLRVAVTSTLVSMLGALVLATLLRRRAGAVRAVLALPVAAPHLVVAASAVLWLSPGGLVDRIAGSMPLTLVGDRAGVGIVIVYVMKEIPFLTLLALASLDRGTLELEHTAAMAGASRFRRLRDVILPRLAVPLAAGAMVVAAFVLGAVEVPLVVGPTRPDMLGPYALDVVRIDGPAARADAAVVDTVAVVIVVVVATSLGLLTRRRRSR